MTHPLNTIKRTQFPKNRSLCFLVTGVFILIFILVLIFTLTNVSGSGDRKESTLRFVSMVLRHGNRAPLFTYPNDPYENRTRYWPEGEGELLNQGRRGLLETGQFLRRRYDDFLPRTFNSSQVRVLSVDFNRCVDSAQCLLSGLYPPRMGFHAPMNSCRPFPVTAVSLEDDDMLLIFGTPCDKFIQEFSNVIENYVFKEVANKTDIMDYVSDNIDQKLNVSMDGLLMMGALYDTLFVEDKAGYELPDWTKKVFPEELSFFINLFFSAMTHTPTQKKLMSGVLINDILSTMEMKRSYGEDFDRLFDLYSATDVTIHGLWRSMAVRQDVPLPGYGATMIFELHEKDGDYFIKALYKNAAEDDQLFTINFSGCEEDEYENQNEMCRLDTLRKKLENATVVDLQKECRSSELSVQQETKENFIALAYG